MDVNYVHTTSIHVVRACPNDDATDLLAIGGDHSVEVLLIVSSHIPLFPLSFTSSTHRQTPLVDLWLRSILAPVSQLWHGHLWLYLPPPVIAGSSSEILYPILFAIS